MIDRAKIRNIIQTEADQRNEVRRAVSSIQASKSVDSPEVESALKLDAEYAIDRLRRGGRFGPEISGS